MKSIKKITLSTLLLFFTVQVTLFAHPGHGDTAGHSWFHYLTEPMHVMVFGAVLLMISLSSTWLILRMKKRTKERA